VELDTVWRCRSSCGDRGDAESHRQRDRSRGETAELVRADMRSISRGVTAGRIGSVVAGRSGAHGSIRRPAPRVASATGVTSGDAYSVAAILLALAFMPSSACV